MVLVIIALLAGGYWLLKKSADIRANIQNYMRPSVVEEEELPVDNDDISGRGIKYGES